MGKNKLRRFAENAEFEHVFQPNLKELVAGSTYMQGEWGQKCFGNNNPITVEMGCGGGEYTTGLGRMFPDRNFIGVDVKGARIWKGARLADGEALKNVAFLRTKIEFVDRCFSPEDGVDEIWLTFSDPQPKDEKGNKKLTSPKFIERYARFLKPGGLIHIKTDSDLLYEWTMEALKKEKFEIETYSDDIYGEYADAQGEPMKSILNFKTFYELKWLQDGLKIKYIRIRMPN